jgi:glyoxylase-like metal-dependent hydrolase (beta-lactamase superfamily II)
VVSEAGAPAGSPCWIIDAGFEPKRLIDHVRKLGLKPDALILTHTHVDHIAGLDEVLEAFPGLKVFGHAAEKDWLKDPVLNLGAPIGMDVRVHGMDGFIREGQELILGTQRWQVLETPGHSPGGITLYNAAAWTAIVGDALFAGSIGRTDFPGSDFNTLARSIRTKLYTLPDDTRIYPGHGPPSSIGAEKRSNPFVRP